MDDAPAPSRLGAFVPSLVAAGGILFWLALTAIIGSLISAAGSQASGGQPSVLLDISRFGETMLLSTLFAVAALVTFWLLAPITARLTPVGVVARSLVAGLVAVVIVWPVEFFLLSALFDQSSSPGLIGLSPAYSPTQVMVLALTNELQLILFRLPLFVLAGLALWLWLRRKETAHGEA